MFDICRQFRFNFKTGFCRMQDSVVKLGIKIQIDIWFGCMFLKKKKPVISQPVKSLTEGGANDKKISLWFLISGFLLYYYNGMMLSSG